MYYAGIDVGATSIRGIIGDETATTLARATTDTPREPPSTTVTDAVLDTLHHACDHADIEPSDVTAAGIGAAGHLDRTTGAIATHANLPTTTPIPLTQPITTVCQTDHVVLLKDTHAAVTAEHFFDPDAPGNLVYLTISTGIGAGITTDQTLVRGWNGNAGEVGHLTLDPDGVMTCGCGHPGHWEAYAAGRNIPRYAGTLHHHDPVDTALPITDPGFDAADVFNHADTDPLAATVVDQLATWNARGLTAIVHAYAPEQIRIGGAVALNNPEHVIDPLPGRVSDGLILDQPTITPSPLGEDAVVRGALAAAITHTT